jgi:NAD(P)-dependent dehydrogenase (short-subunit alcohol dehydrogenase family)
MKRTALITGASKGLGRVIATFLARSGYEVVITARGAEELEDVARSLIKEGARVQAIAGDVTGAEHRRRLAVAIDQLATPQRSGGAGGLDVLVNNASDLGPSPMPELASYPLDALRAVFDANVVAPVALVQELLPALRERRGLIVNITSDAAVGAYETWGGYGASKAALELASRTLAAELREAGVDVVAVDPGDMRTDMHQAAFPGSDISDRPLPDVTIPFWAWLFTVDHLAVSGGRYQAQSERWELDAPEGAPIGRAS